MRKKFHDELDQLVHRLSELVSQVDAVMRQATVALLDADDELAEMVIADDEIVAVLQSEVDSTALDILVRQQPVATDLRTVVACLRMSVDLRRMSKLARHIAEIARAHHPRHAIPDDLRPAVLAMANRAQHIVTAAGRAVVTRNAGTAMELEREDDELDLLQEELYRALLAEPRRLGTEDVVDIALIGRYYERYADHAVSLARRVAYLAGVRSLDYTPAADVRSATPTV